MARSTAGGGEPQPCLRPYGVRCRHADDCVLSGQCVPGPSYPPRFVPPPARVALRPDGQFAWILEVERFGLTVGYRAEEVLGVFAVERAGAGVIGECVGLGRAIELVLADAAEVSERQWRAAGRRGAP